MTWTQLHQRMAFMAEVIDRAEPNVEPALQFVGERAADVERLFGSEHGLFLSLWQRWATLLTAKLDQAEYDDISADDAVTELVAHQPGLRALLDHAAEHSPQLQALQRGAHRMIALVGNPPSAGSIALSAGA